MLLVILLNLPLREIRVDAVGLVDSQTCFLNLEAEFLIIITSSRQEAQVL